MTKSDLVMPTTTNTAGIDIITATAATPNKNSGSSACFGHYLYDFVLFSQNLSTLSADNQITNHWSTKMTHSLERNLNELEILFCKNNGTLSSGGTGAADYLYFHSLNGVQLLTKMLSRIMNGTRERLTSLTDLLAAFYELLCGEHLDVPDNVLQSQLVIDLLDILCHRINVWLDYLLDTTFMSNSGGGTTTKTCDIVVGAHCRLLSTIFDTLYGHYSTLTYSTDDSLAFNHIIQDVTSYIVWVGMINKLSHMMANPRDPVDDNPELTQCLRSIHRFGARLAADDTQLMLTFQMTHIGGVVSLIYGVHFHSGALQRADGDRTPPAVDHTLDLTLEVIRLLNYVSLLNLNVVQLRHICSYLLWYCTHHKREALVNETILLVGNFVGFNDENQAMLESGQRPTVVQQLCSLPIEYFSDDRLSAVLVQTLIACCFQNPQNWTVLEKEMSTLILLTFSESKVVGLQLRAVDSHVSAGFRRPTNSLGMAFEVIIELINRNQWSIPGPYLSRLHCRYLDTTMVTTTAITSGTGSRCVAITTDSTGAFTIPGTTAGYWPRVLPTNSTKFSFWLAKTGRVNLRRRISTITTIIAVRKLHEVLVLPFDVLIHTA
ncbi:unnamed protein product [Medioppia subpectinata]|uniref:Uncharacterized protein n=1 Tax=Medioppia subpectinata TaxID=1979941 RepID=A0A7R9PVS4_9ACAR|nr:unnamed protein product [Medioppia subpectinata]CAG2103004.1 unnamed protein product [Medioppia subpectinata]